MCTSTSGLCGGDGGQRDALCHFHSNMVRATYPYQLHPHATLRSPITIAYLCNLMFLANAPSNATDFRKLPEAVCPCIVSRW